MDTLPDQHSCSPNSEAALTANQRAQMRQIELGFMFSHSLMSETSRQALTASSTALAVVELLIEQGIIDAQALTARLETVRASLIEQIEQSGLGLFVNEEHPDKYQLHDLPQINCAERVHLCKAACCTLRFPLARQDVEEGIVRWDFGRPYWNLTNDTGYCTHCDLTQRRCGVYDHRPAPCRLYDCRADQRIWLDFDQMILNPDLQEWLASDA